MSTDLIHPKRVLGHEWQKLKPERIRIECSTCLHLIYLACCDDCYSKTKKLHSKVTHIPRPHKSQLVPLVRAYSSIFVIVVNNTAVDSQRYIAFYLFISFVTCVSGGEG